MERFIKGYLRWLIISIYYWNVYPRVFALIDHLHLSLKRLSKGISVGWSSPSIIETYIKGYFSWLITSTNDGKVYPRVFQFVDHLHKLSTGLSKGISVGWSLRSTTETFIQGYFRWLITSINYRKIYSRIVPSVAYLHLLSKGLSEGISVDSSPRSTIERFIEGNVRWLIISIKHWRVVKGIYNVLTLSWTTKRVPHKVV